MRGGSTITGFGTLTGFGRTGLLLARGITAQAAFARLQRVAGDITRPGVPAAR